MKIATPQPHSSGLLTLALKFLQNTREDAKVVASCFPLGHPQPLSWSRLTAGKGTCLIYRQPLAVVELLLRCFGSVFSPLSASAGGNGDSFPPAVFPQCIEPCNI